MSDILYLIDEDGKRLKTHFKLLLLSIVKRVMSRILIKLLWNPPPPFLFSPTSRVKKKPGLSSSGILIVWQLKKWLTFPEFTGLRRIIRLVPWQLTGPVSDNVARCSQVHNVFTGCLPFVLYQLRAFLTCLWPTDERDWFTQSG